MIFGSSFENRQIKNNFDNCKIISEIIVLFGQSFIVFKKAPTCAPIVYTYEFILKSRV